MLLALLAIWTNAYHTWPKTLALCRRQEMVWCRQPIGAHGAFVCGARGAFMCVVCGWHWSSCASGERREVPHFHTAAPKVGPHARACAHTRPRNRRGVGKRPHVRWSVERTASLAVAKRRCSGGQTWWTCELSGLCKVYNPKRWAAEGAVLFRPIMWLYSASVVLVWDSFLPFTFLWPYSSKVHLVLATALIFI